MVRPDIGDIDMSDNQNEYFAALKAKTYQETVAIMAKMALGEENESITEAVFAIVCDAPPELLAELVGTSDDPEDWVGSDDRFEDFRDIGDWTGYVYAEAQELMSEILEATVAARKLAA